MVKTPLHIDSLNDGKGVMVWIKNCAMKLFMKKRILKKARVSKSEKMGKAFIPFVSFLFSLYFSYIV